MISDKLVYLNDTKTAIKNAIEAKGVTVGEATFREYATKIGDISTGGGAVEEKDVNFYDYDGTLLHSYTIAEAQALTSLPTAPTQDRLTFQEWNYTLAEVQATTRPLDIGATYITTSGKTEAFLTLTPVTGLDVPIFFNKTLNSEFRLELRKVSDNSLVWGVTNTEIGNQNATVSGVTEYGDYRIDIFIINFAELGATYSLGNGSASTGFIGGANANYKNSLTKLFYGNNIQVINTHSLTSHAMLTKVSITNNIVTYGSNIFENSSSLKYIVLSGINGSLGGGSFTACYSLNGLSMPNGITATGFSSFSNCNTLKKLIFPSTITSLTSSSFSNTNSTTVLYDFSKHTSVPTLSSTNVFTGIKPICKILVPLSLEATWKAATNWSTYANYIVGV